MSLQRHTEISPSHDARRIIAAGLKASVCMAVLLFAAPVARAQLPDPFAHLRPPADAPERPTLLVLKNGQVITGPMEPQVGGYMVAVPTGRQLFTYDQVWTAATSLGDAYNRIRRNQRNPTANERIELARWCYQNGLHEEARIELALALQLEPERPEARAVLKRIEAEMLQRPTAQSPPPATGSVSGDTVPPREASLDRLSGERTAEFVRVIQPILLHRCGNAACHGEAGSSDFRLQPAFGARSNKVLSDANLAAVLQQVDFSRPEESPLLLQARSNRGAHQGLLHERRAEDNLTTVNEWLRSVSAELAPRSPVTRPAPAITAAPSPSPHPLVSAVVPTPAVPRGPGEIIQASGVQPTAPGPGRLPVAGEAVPERLSAVDDAFLRRILDAERPGPFDPDEFNLLVHGRESRPKGSR